MIIIIIRIPYRHLLVIITNNQRTLTNRAIENETERGGGWKQEFFCKNIRLSIAYIVSVTDDSKDLFIYITKSNFYQHLMNCDNQKTLSTLQQYLFQSKKFY